MNDSDIIRKASVDNGILSVPMSFGWKHVFLDKSGSSEMWEPVDALKIERFFQETDQGGKYKCPECKSSVTDNITLVIHLNDSHKLSYEAIADCLEGLNG